MKMKAEDPVPKPSTLLATGLIPGRKQYLKKMCERSWVDMTALNLRQTLERVVFNLVI